MGGIEKVCGWRLGAIVNKIETINAKIILIKYIDTPPNPTITNMLSITDSGASIYILKKSTPELLQPQMRKFT